MILTEKISPLIVSTVQSCNDVDSLFFVCLFYLVFVLFCFVFRFCFVFSSILIIK